MPDDPPATAAPWWRRKWRVACFTGDGQRVEDTGRTFRLRLNAERERDTYAAMPGLLPLDWRVERAH